MPWLGVLVFAGGIAMMTLLRGPGWLGAGLVLTLCGGSWAVLAIAHARIAGSAREEHLSDSQLAALRAALRAPGPPEPPSS